MPHPIRAVAQERTCAYVFHMSGKWREGDDTASRLSLELTAFEVHGGSAKRLAVLRNSLAFLGFTREPGPARVGPLSPPFAKAFGPTWDAGNEVVSFVSWEAIGVCALSVWDRSLTAYRMDVPRAPVDEVEREWALHLEVADPDAAMPFVHTSYRAVWADQWQEQGPGYLGLVQSPDSLILDVRRSPRHDFAIDWFRMGRGYLGTTHSADRDLPDLLVDGMGFYLVLDDDVGIDMRYLPLQARP